MDAATRPEYSRQQTWHGGQFPTTRAYLMLSNIVETYL